MYSFDGILGNENWLVVGVVILVAYLIGNISPATIIARAYGINIKEAGSGNAGTTNVLRVLGKKAAIATLIIDVLKGTGAVLLGGFLLGNQGAMLCVIAVLCGHIWPVLLKFKGGKGVATGFGALMGLNPLLGLTCLAIVILVVIITKTMSKGSVVGAITFPIVTYFIEPDFIILGTIFAIIVLYKHKENIGRIIRGEEPKMSFASKSKTEEEKKS